MDIRQFFVKSDNITVPNELKGTQVINLSKEATLTDLYKAINERYRFPQKISFQLWTGPLSMKGKRFDNQTEIIDSSITNVYIKVPIFGEISTRHRQHTLPIDELEMK